MLNSTGCLIGEEVMSQHAQPSGGQQSQQNRRKVHGWLMDEGWRVGEGHAPDAAWLLNATDQGGRTIVVAQPINRADMVVIQGGIKIDENVRRHLGEMPQHERNEFHLDLQYSLLQMGVEYIQRGEPLEFVGIAQRIYSDALIRDRFVQRIILVRNAVVMVLLKIAGLMNQPPVAPAEPPPIGFRPSSSE
jgi:hypothetical protein